MGFRSQKSANQIMNGNMKSQGMAITSLVLGIFSMVCFGILTGIPAIICGHLAHNRTRKMPERYAGAGMAIAGFVLGYTSILTTFVIAAMLLPALSQAKSRAQSALAQANGNAQSIRCVNNMKQIGVAFRIYAADHADRFPFNVPSKEGGTMELSAMGADGFDRDAARIFQVLSNELSTPSVLVCPADQSKQPAKEFQNLLAANVSYQVRSGTNLDETNPSEVLVRCPVHGNEVFCDGSVHQGRQR